MSSSNSSEFYKGKRKRTGPALLVTVIVLCLIAFVILLFYGLQKYIVVTNDGVHLELPILMGSTEQSEDGGITRSFDPVTAELVVGEADYSNVAPSAGEELEAIKAVYISSGNISEAAIASVTEDMCDAGTLVLDVKTNSGQLVWNSQTEIALGYGTSGSVDLKSIVSGLKEKNIRVAARLCCLADSLLASRYDDICLKTTQGVSYADSSGAWLDPYSNVVKNYIISLCRELDSMGFDEIILLGARMPNAAEGVSFTYNTRSTAEPTPVTAVAGFALDVTRALKSCNAKISVQLSGDTAFTEGVDAVTGQNAELFFKVFDRVYLSCASADAADKVSFGEGYVTLGNKDFRIVPMCEDGTPSTESYVLM